jgi:hypothetical protein
MGLFGKKEKTEATARITDFFSEEDLAVIRTTLDPKITEKAYKLEYRGFALDLLNAVNNQEKLLDKKELTALLYASGCMTKIEPSLAPLLKTAIEKMQAFRKG